MTNLSNTFDSMFKDFGKFYVGSDDLINRLSKIHNDAAKNIPNYPPYNIKKTGTNTYQIEVAVAGFGKEDIDVELMEDTLVITGKTTEDKSDFLFRGIANRAFTRSFTLNDQIVVNNAEIVNGMLRVSLEKIIPDHRKPRKINVNDSLSDLSVNNTLLTENV